MRKHKMPSVQQMEFNLLRTQPCRACPGRRRRLPEAQWWFQQMRQVVLNTPEWTPPTQEQHPATPAAPAAVALA